MGFCWYTLRRLQHRRGIQHRSKDPASDPDIAEPSHVESMHVLWQEVAH